MKLLVTALLIVASILTGGLHPANAQDRKLPLDEAAVAKPRQFDGLFGRGTSGNRQDYIASDLMSEGLEK